MQCVCVCTRTGVCVMQLFVATFSVVICIILQYCINCILATTTETLVTTTRTLESDTPVMVSKAPIMVAKAPVIVAQASSSQQPLLKPQQPLPQVQHSLCACMYTCVTIIFISLFVQLPLYHLNMHALITQGEFKAYNQSVPAHIANS